MEKSAIGPDIKGLLKAGVDSKPFKGERLWEL